jgi:hypothetical protein
MKLLTYHSPSHASLAGHLRSTMAREPAFELQAFTTPLQPAANGSYNDHGFNTAMRYKLESILSRMDGMAEDEIGFYVDADVVILRPCVAEIEKAMIGNLMVFQDGPGEFNLGVFAFRNCYRVRAMLFEVIQKMGAFHDDQDCFNALFSREPGLGKLDHRFSHYGLINHKHHWTDQAFNLPDACRLFHACYTVGVETKMKLLQQVMSDVSGTAVGKR